MKHALFLSFAFLLLLASFAYAGSATWNLNPTSRDWNVAANWTPNTVPDDPADTATFDVSKITAISQTGVIDLAEIIFNPGASAFTITAGRDLNISGAGITNNSGVEQNLIVPGRGASIHFFHSATVGENTVFTQTGPSLGRVTEIAFHDTTSAGNATIINEDSSGTRFYDSATAANGTFINKAGSNGGYTEFFNSASAGSANFIVEGGSPSGFPSIMYFFDQSNAADATITVNASSDSNISPGLLYFYDATSVGSAIVTANGATSPGTSGAEIYVSGNATAGNATFVLNGGTNGGSGARLTFQDGSLGGTAQLKLSGNTTVDLTQHDPGTMTFGSLEGNGLVIGTMNLIVGTNNVTTTFSGNIQGNILPEGTSLTKTGSGNLTLTAVNSYGGGTFVEGRGTLFVNNVHGSGTGTGTVQVDSGELAGNGFISGPVVVGNGTRSAARLKPGKSEHGPAILTMGSTLTFNADGSYVWLVDSLRGIASSVIAKSVTVDNAALFIPAELQSGTLRAETIFTVITNKFPGAIVGTFANLPDGGTIRIGNNTFQANYEGGDGNDLTLTVVP